MINEQDLKPSYEQKSGNPKWEADVRAMFESLRGHSEITSFEISGVNIKILPDVFSPEIFFESKWFAERISELARDKRFLEIGPGTGITSLFAAHKGADVTAIDINENAVKNTRLNFSENNLKVDVRQGSVYEPLDESERFDVIFWNHPFNKTEQLDEDPFLKSVFDYKYKNIETYISQSRKHLSRNGRIFLGTSNIADLSEIEGIADRYNYNFVLIEKVDKQTEVDGSDVDFRIYEFVDRG